jgi:hypothetical protein
VIVSVFTLDVELTHEDRVQVSVDSERLQFVEVEVQACDAPELHAGV